MGVKNILKTTKGKVAVGIVAGFIIGGTSMGASTEQIEAVERVGTLTAKVSELENEKIELDKKVKEAAPWFEMEEEKREEEKKKKEEEKKKKEEAEKKAQEAEAAKIRAKEEADRKKKEAEEKKGYNTGISYGNLARTPDKYKGKKVKFKGKIIQVMEGDGVTQMRMAVNSDYDQIIYIEILEGITKERILEDDVITIMGISNGLLSYQSTMGGKITVPAVIVDKVE